MFAQLAFGNDAALHSFQYILVGSSSWAHAATKMLLRVWVSCLYMSVVEGHNLTTTSVTTTSTLRTEEVYHV